jgi:zinc transport system permease protein
MDSFLVMALLGGLLASFASGIMGSFVVIKKIASLSGSIAHSILGGIGIALWMKYNLHYSWIDPFYGAIIAALFSALLIGYIHLHFKQKEDALIATIWSTGMALGIIFISMIKGYKADFENFLFGNILLITEHHLLLLLLLDVVIILVLLFFFKYFLAITFDEEQAYLQGVPVSLVYFLLLSLISLSIVLLIQVIGTILVIALLTIPPTIARMYTKKLSMILVLSVLLTILLNLGGISLSYFWNTPPGATIALTATALYAVAIIFKKKVVMQVFNKS